MLSRTRPAPGQAYGPDAPPGGLRFRTSSPSGHGRLDNRADPPFANPFIRITSVSPILPGRPLSMCLRLPTAPRDAWQFFFSPDYPVVAPWFDSQANTGDDFRLEVGTASVYPLTIRVSDSVGSSIEQTIQVRLASAPTGAPALPVITDAVVSAHSADVTLAPVSGVVSEYALERGRNQPTVWTAFTGTRLLIPRLATATRYNLWIRHRNTAGAGPAVFLEVQTLSAAGIVQAPAPAGFSLDNNAGDRKGILDGALRGRWNTADITTQVLGYDYQLTTADRPLSEDGWQAMPASTSSTSVFTWYGLRNGTAYRLGVRARNDAGPGRHSEIIGTPQAGQADTEYSRWQIQIMMDLAGQGDDPRGAPWYDLASRCLEVYVRYGREARQQLTATGTCAFLLETSDDFINVEGTSLYRLDDLQNRIVHINEVLETSSGLRRKTRFAGLVETATFQPSGQRSVIQVTAVDIFGLMAQDTAVFGQDLPAQTTGDRIRLLLDTAGWEPNGTGTRSYNPELIDEGSKTCARIPVAIGESLEVNLLDELNLIGQSEGGRVFISGGGDNLPGSVTFEGASPVTIFDGRISDQLSSDPATIEMDGQPVIQSEDSFLYNDFELSYPGGEAPERIPPNALSVAIWGKRTYDLYTEVRTDQESTRALLRQLRKQYGIPRRWISTLPVKAHFQTETAARLLQDLDLSKSLLVDHRPPGSREPITGLQRIDYVEISYTGLDKQFVKLDMTLGLLIPEASAYWILDVDGADRLDSNETFLAPRRNLDPLLGAPGGRLPGGWRATQDRNFQIVSANRYDGFLSQQTLPTYVSEAERDRFETSPVDGHSCVLVETDATGTRAFWLYEYSGADFQWLKRGQLTHSDANPTTQTLLLADAVRGILGLAAGNVLASATAPTNLRT